MLPYGSGVLLHFGCLRLAEATTRDDGEVSRHTEGRRKGYHDKPAGGWARSVAAMFAFSAAIFLPRRDLKIISISVT